MLLCLRCHRCPCWNKPLMGGSHVGWKRQLGCLWLCFPPSNGSQTSATLPLYLHLCHWDQFQCVSVTQEPSLQFSGLQLHCFVTKHSLLHFLLGPTAISGRVKVDGQTPCIFFLPGSGSSQNRVVALLYSVLCPNRPLGSAILYVDRSGRSACGYRERTPQSDFTPFPQSCSEFCSEAATPISAFLPSLLACSPIFSHLQMFQCIDLSEVCVY